ncbi:putative zinc-type alcohol dehydrogenase-like protein YjmD, partial [Haemophilus influenzae]
LVLFLIYLIIQKII